ncbi:tripartite ATP-independent transporter solute receptor, DctP family [Maribacter sedimenticola]|uniref:Tripartite ATP-independent transporter solute receptor, DctP family n=1 Tax=Maribacter sedimenticola TaxID=228956 RepID=A0ABY1SEH1_9FLAO|nr:TRAP transporter substrate-binding protein [Maribacter sedimenticola]SNR31486.1 tripartite ATP-independent transporter solute receptor, DctP family [Maribacter sedimenticola]
MIAGRNICSWLLKGKHGIGALLCCVFLFNSCVIDSDKKILFFAHSLPTTHPVHKGIVAMKESVEKKSNGKLVVKIFPDGQLGTEREVLELLQIGSIAMTKVSAASMSNFAPAYQVTSIPYLFRDREHLFKVLEGEVGKELLESSSAYLLRGLCFYDAGARSFYAKKKPVKTPQDLDGMKIRTMNDEMSVNMVNTLGGSATPMAYGELYTALQQNVVDGAENNIPSFVTSNHYEVCKYYTFDEHTMVPDVVVIGTKFWNTLSTQEQQWLQDAANESVIKQKQYWQETVAENMEVLKKANVEFLYPDKTKFSAKASGVMEKMMQDEKMKTVIEKILAQ